MDALLKMILTLFAEGESKYIMSPLPQRESKYIIVPPCTRGDLRGVKSYGQTTFNALGLVLSCTSQKFDRVCLFQLLPPTQRAPGLKLDRMADGKVAVPDVCCGFASARQQL